MRILMVTPELDPYVKVGGLGDMVGALARELSAQGHDVRCVCPMYGSIKRVGKWEPHDKPLGAEVGAGAGEFCRVWETTLPSSKARAYFLEHNRFFERPDVYSGPFGSFSDNDQRFTFLSRAAINLSRWLDWQPDVFHCHDWTTGLVPVYLNTVDRGSPLGAAASVFTIHNLEHQGYSHPSVLDYARLPHWLLTPDNLEALGAVNLMKAGLYHATKLTTVSPNYAKEIQTPPHGFGLDHVLRFRAADLVGILNGIDMEQWNPATDKHISAPFSVETLAEKSKNKTALQKEFGLEVDASIPLYGVVSRLFRQKGLDLLAATLPTIARNMRVQFAILGTGEGDVETAMRGAAMLFPQQVGVRIGFDNALAHRIQAGSDFFVMPSRAEPCGLTQMYAMRYGTLPIVRTTGGLADTVEQYDETKGTGTGFRFDNADANAVYYAIGWACSTFYDRPAHIAAMSAQAMQRDSSWGPYAKQYTEVYEWAVGARRAMLG